MNIWTQAYRKFRYNNRNFLHNQIKKFVQGVVNKTILEIGSGEASVEHLFNSTNTFVKTDIDAKYGYPVIDVMSFQQKKKYDIIICNNVFEHIFNIHKATNNIWQALKPKGVLLFHIPFNYPLHAEPEDYWRITSHGLKKLFAQFSIVHIISHGMRKKPSSYFVRAEK